MCLNGRKKCLLSRCSFVALKLEELHLCDNWRQIFTSIRALRYFLNYRYVILCCYLYFSLEQGSIKIHVLHGVVFSFAISGSSDVNYLFPRWKEDSLQPTYSILQVLSSSSHEAGPQMKDSPYHKCAGFSSTLFEAIWRHAIL